LAPQAVAALLVTNIAMFVRNGLILAIFAPKAVSAAVWPLGAMAGATGLWVWLKRGNRRLKSEPLKLSSPISLRRILKFSVLFLALACSGTLAQRLLGSLAS
jgi:uncharacterized membrane protein (DUF4010 family)